MKHLSFIGLLIILPLLGISQGEWNNWYFGTHAGVTFNFGAPQALTNGMMSTIRTTVSVSDSLGNVQFYSNGATVWNRNGQIMPNGHGLHADTSADQSVNQIQVVGDDSSYYLFTIRHIAPPPQPYDGLHYSIINMRLDGGLGDIEAGEKEVPLQTTSYCPSMLTTTRHQNNKDAWVIVRNTTGGNNYAAYLVTASGISTTPVLSPCLIVQTTPVENGGYMKVSPDGTTLVYPYMDSIEYCNFNSLTGQVTPLFKFIVGTYANGLWAYMEFSWDSKYLYLSTGDWTWNASDIYQYDNTQKNYAQFKASETHVGHSSHGIHLQLGPDEKIYGPEAGIDSLSVINNPGTGGMGCNFQPNAVSLSGRLAQNGVPQFIQRYYAYIHDTGYCQGLTVQFTPLTWPPADSVHWDFGDPGSGGANFSTLINATHIYTGQGTYLVNLFVRHTDNRVDTTSKDITILPAPTVNLGPDSTICAGDSVVLNAGSCSGCTYVWDDLTTNQMNISNAQTYTAKTSGEFRATATISNGCYGRDTVTITVNPIQLMSVTISASANPVCVGTSVTFTALPVNSGPAPVFLWKVNGIIAGTNSPTFTYIPNNGDVVTCELVASMTHCISGNPAFSNPISMVVNNALVAGITINASFNPVCAGNPVTFTATPANGGPAPVFQWKVNGINVGTNSSTYTYIPNNGDVVTCVLTSSLTSCISGNPATSNAITMTVNPNLAVSITISASANPFCEGSPVTFTGTPVNGSPTPSFQWKVNGVNVGTNSPDYTYTPSNGDQVLCVLSSQAQCTTGNPATSNILTMVENSTLPAVVSITASSNPFCPGSPVTFTATPTNGGTAPSYQWKVNGSNAGTNSHTFIYNPLNGDSVSCVMTSNLACVTGNPATSDTLIMSGNPAPIVTFTSCFDTITTVNAKPILLKGGIPLGGTYSGPGVNSLTGVFTPSVAGTGTKTITYSYTNVFLCMASKSIHIIVEAAPAFTCGNDLTDIRDTKVYATVQIGSQCWMASNLNYGTILASSQDQRDNCIAEKYCYSDNPVNCTNQGGLYQWDEVMQYDDTPGDQGFCPPAWHIPTENEWNTLFSNYINNGFAGSPLKYSGFSGFNALLSGVRHIDKSWDFQGFATFFWSSTSYGGYKAWGHGMNEADPSVSIYPSSRVNAFSVRCIHD